MNHVVNRFQVAIILIFAVVLTGILATPISAFNPVFNSPFTSPVKDKDSGSPSPDDLGEVHPETRDENRLVRDPETPGYAFRFPSGAISEPVKARVYNSGIPAGVTGPANSVGSPFFFGVWRMRDGKSVGVFDETISIHAAYDDLGLSTSQEAGLRLFMYDPSLQAWIKLGGSVDIYDNVVSALVTSLTPFEGGSTLFVVGSDATAALEQSVDETGNTRLSGKGLLFHVPPGVVEVGTHFEATFLPPVLESDGLTVFNAVDIRAYFVDRSHLTARHQQIMSLPGSITVELEIDPNLCGTAKPTVVTFRDGRWVELDSTLVGGSVVAVDIHQLGTFGVTCRK